VSEAAGPLRRANTAFQHGLAELRSVKIRQWIHLLQGMREVTQPGLPALSLKEEGAHLGFAEAAPVSFKLLECDPGGSSLGGTLIWSSRHHNLSVGVLSYAGKRQLLF
jgi:hypothetical protein